MRIWTDDCGVFLRCLEWWLISPPQTLGGSDHSSTPVARFPLRPEVLIVIRQGGPPSIPLDLELPNAPAEQIPQASDGAAAEVARLAAQLSHDMRIPLSSIIATLELLEEELGENPGPAVVAMLERTKVAADRMRQMLDLNMVIDPVACGPTRFDVDLYQVVHQLVLDSALLLELAGATLDVGRLPVVHAHPDEMYSVFQNLLSNAVKFTRPGVRPQVSISARHVPYGWRVSVTDNGIGIPAERRTDVFTLFSRVNADVEGHGIGLGTVAHTVHNLRGRVGAEAAPGGGTEVWFELPMSSDA